MFGPQPYAGRPIWFPLCVRKPTLAFRPSRRTVCNTPYHGGAPSSRWLPLSILGTPDRTNAPPTNCPDRTAWTTLCAQVLCVRSDISGGRVL